MHFVPRQHSGAVFTLIKLTSYIVSSRILFNPQWQVVLTHLKIKYASFCIINKKYYMSGGYAVTQLLKALC